jgi:hypothetical protein
VPHDARLPSVAARWRARAAQHAVRRGRDARRLVVPDHGSRRPSEAQGGGGAAAPRDRPSPPWGLQAMARRHRPSVYLNLGHSNHSAPCLRPMRQSGARVVVLIHDLIPLTIPTSCHRNSPRVSPAHRAGAGACLLVVAVSGDTENALRAHWPDGPAPPIVRAEIGVEVPDPARRGKVRPRPFPDGRHAGTAEEPRRRSGRMGGLAGDMAAERCSRGWTSWVSRAGAGRRSPRESAPIRDMARRSSSTPPRATTLRAPIPRPIRCSIPSLAEGFGLPPHEALDHGLLPICADLPSLRAGLGDAAVYLDPRDVYSWEETIRKRISGKLDGPRARSAKRPGWQDHFEKVAAALAELRD